MWKWVCESLRLENWACLSKGRLLVEERLLSTSSIDSHVLRTHFKIAFPSHLCFRVHCFSSRVHFRSLGSIPFEFFFPIVFKFIQHFIDRIWALQVLEISHVSLLLELELRLCLEQVNIISNSYHLILLILFIDHSFLLSSLDNLSYCIGMKSTEDSLEEIPWRQVLVWVVREVVLHLWELIQSLLKDDVERELIILRDVAFLHILNFQSLNIIALLTTLSPDKISFKNRMGV